MSKIDNNTFVRFIMNDMTSDELRYVEDELIKDNEGLSIIACSISLWDTKANALDIVGDVICKKNSSEDRVNSTYVSIVANEPTNNAMVQLTKKDGQSIKKITDAFIASTDSSVSLEENLKSFYLSQCPGSYPEDADKTIEGVKQGITSFDSALSQMVSSEGFAVEKIVGHILEGKSLEEKYDILINFLIALHTMQLENVKNEDGTFIESFDQIKGRLYTAGVPVTQEMIDEATSKIKDILENGTISLSSTEAVDALIHQLDESEENLKLFVANQEELFQQKMILSTAIMIGARNGSIDAFQGQEMSPQVIGAGVSAGLEQQKLMADIQSGNTTLETALKVLKYIGAAAILCAGLYYGISLIFGFTSIVVAWGMNIVGLSTAGCVASWLFAALFVTLPLSSAYSKSLFFILNKASQFYDWVVSKISSKTDDEISFIDWLNFKIKTGEIVEETTQTDQTQTVLA